MASADNYAPFYVFDQMIQQPFANGMNATVSSAISAIQGPLTAAVTLWIIVTGLLVMRGDLDTRRGITRILSVCLVVGIVSSVALYDQYVVSFFTVGLPNWLASNFLGVTGSQPSAHQFDALWDEANEFFRAASKNLNFYNVLYSVELGILQDLVVFPIGITFLIFETAKILMDVIVSIGPFLLIGYLFQATRGVADRWIGKLIGLAILMLLVDVVLSIIIQGDQAYFNNSISSVTVATVADTITIGIQFVIFLTLGCLITCFLPAIASFLGGGVAVGPLQMAASAMQAGRTIQAVRGRGQEAAKGV
jgi:type IV secretion system protein VirB6